MKNPSQKTHTRARRQRCTSNKKDLFEVAVFPLLPVHHVVENWDHDVPDLSLRHQGDTQEGTHHPGDEVRLVVTCSNRQMLNLGEIRRKRRKRREEIPNFCHMLKSS